MRFLVGSRSLKLSLLLVCGPRLVPTTSASAAFISASSSSCAVSSQQSLLTKTPTRTRSRMKMATSAASEKSSSNNARTLRVLALHGSEGNADEFSDRLIPFQQALSVEKIQLEITSVQAPFPKGGGYAWWTMPAGIRSYTAKEYQGFEESATRLLDWWSAGDSDSAPFDLVLGHSQGAILLASLIALGRTPYTPSMGYILNGCGYCRPFEVQVKTLNVTTEEENAPRCLFVIGANDKVTPPAIQEELRDAFRVAGLEIATLKHPKGHGLPKEDDSEAMQQMVDWILGKALVQ